MIRAIAVLSILLAVFVATDRALEQKHEAMNPRHEKLISLVEPEKLSANPVAAMGLVVPGRSVEMLYVKDGDAWRMPQYRGAYALTDPIEGMIRDLTASFAVSVDRRGRPDAFFGFREGQNLTVKLYDKDNNKLFEAACGNPLPGLWGRDSYLRPAGGETIYHINGNPVVKVLANMNPQPLVDPKVIPAALVLQGQLERVEFEPAEAHEIQWIERRERPKSDEPDPSMPPQMQNMPQFDWFAMIGGAERQVDERSASAYVNFIKRATYSRVPRPNELPESAMAPSDSRIVLEYRAKKSKPAPPDGEEAQTEEPEEEAEIEVRREYIELRGKNPNGDEYVYFSASDMIATVPKQKASLFFPSLQLLENPALSSMYEAIEPPGFGGGFGP